MEHGEEVFSIVFPAGDEPPRIVQPSKEPFDLPTAAIAAQGATVLRGRIHATHVVRSDQLDAVAIAQSLIQPFAVIGAVADQPLQGFREEALLEGGFGELCFMRRSAGDADGERKTMAADDRHDFTAFSSASRADSRAPFLALEKLASMKVSDRSSLPRSRRSSASAVKTRVRVPSRRHC